jgi:hypothetical protein
MLCNGYEILVGLMSLVSDSSLQADRVSLSLNHVLPLGHFIILHLPHAKWDRIRHRHVE